MEKRGRAIRRAPARSGRPHVPQRGGRPCGRPPKTVGPLGGGYGDGFVSKTPIFDTNARIREVWPGPTSPNVGPGCAAYALSAVWPLGRRMQRWFRVGNPHYRHERVHPRMVFGVVSPKLRTDSGGLSGSGFRSGVLHL